VTTVVPVLPWLRTNLALLVVCSSMVSGAAGALVTMSSYIQDMKHLVVDRGLQLAEHAHQLDLLHQNMIDVDRRLNEQKAYTEELRRQRDVQVAGLEQRIAILEAQIRFLADRTPTPQLGGRR
jgi:uncharacterized coiled-coil protein SlyX